MTDWRTLRSVVSRALANGGTRRNGSSFFSYEWNIAGQCQRPVPVELYAAPAAEKGRYIEVGPMDDKPLRLNMETRCRKCEACLKARRIEWTMRARWECEIATRTWFGTLTLRPDEQHMALMRARRDAARRGFDFESLSPDHQFRERCRVIGRWVTLYLKRLRKQTGAKLRFVCVFEAHASGLPHIHMLVHETSYTDIVRERQLREQWLQGFSRWKLMPEGDKRAANYVCKYLSKDARARVRASVRYGKPADG